ncbi:hypothetical protein B0H19DRAFT_981954 [Mycena capillaripes]|nr:hypothetical protein B0H19DRAFT_981954 [Mycena capillaripes]
MISSKSSQPLYRCSTSNKHSNGHLHSGSSSASISSRPKPTARPQHLSSLASNLTRC